MDIAVIRSGVLANAILLLGVGAMQSPLLFREWIAIDVADRPVQHAVFGGGAEDQLGGRVGVELVVLGDAEGVGFACVGVVSAISCDVYVQRGEVVYR